ncbi:MAG: efflux RND transporter periplasmic adaptor subunit [Betaproteobacteria bacterium]
MKFIKFAAVLVLAAIVFGAGYLARAARSGAPAAVPAGRRVLYYVDPMHPAYKSDRPGVAPDCGMPLEPVYADEDASSQPPRRILRYQDPKDHGYTSDKPGVNPETGNTLEPVYDKTPVHAIRISPDRQQLAGVRFATAALEDGGRTLRTVGTVGYDETRIVHVHSRVDGWIEQVTADFTGELVRKGQPLLTIYSPDMLASEQELLLAARARDAMRNNPLPDAAAHGESLFEAARRRLQLWDLSDDQIQRVLQTGKPVRTTTLFAPAAGFVTMRNAYPNQRITADTDLYTIADLARVWVMADVFESDIPSIRVGDRARVSVPNTGAPAVSARISYIQPDVDPATRTLKVRLELPNPGLRLKPEMYVDAVFQIPGARRLTIPAGAVVNTGDRQTVFLDLGHGYLEPREVHVGEQHDGRATILSGLSPGDRVVASGTFLIDSESQLKAAARDMGAGTKVAASERHHD